MPIERIDLTVKPTVTPKMITTKGGLTATEGTVAYLVHTWTGYVKEKPFFIIELHSYLEILSSPPRRCPPTTTLWKFRAFPLFEWAWKSTTRTCRTRQLRNAKTLALHTTLHVS